MQAHKKAIPLVGKYDAIDLDKIKQRSLKWNIPTDKTVGNRLVKIKATENLSPTYYKS